MPPCSKEPEMDEATGPGEPRVHPRPCPCCGGRMIIIEVFEAGAQPRHRPRAPPITVRIESS
jgi:hypothetical protein